MNKVYQSMMTLGPAFTVSASEQPDTNSYITELPEPSGSGWLLKQVIPVHNNPKYLQYFWQRELVEESEQSKDSNQAQFRTSKITLGG